MKPDYQKHPELAERFWQLYPAALQAVLLSPAYEGTDATSMAVKLAHAAVAEAVNDTPALGGSEKKLGVWPV